MCSIEQLRDPAQRSAGALSEMTDYEGALIDAP
jgi:hypothetical protein